ncbi:MAG: redox-regulated ATPase YchF [Nitrospinota bacterium]|nr:redox-regulated ATPase YchF [Nitrospinota bacterium]
MGFTCGIVGLPNVGKSTIFNALTCLRVEASNYPFTTSEPNIGIVTVPDDRLEIISQYVPAKKTVATTMQFVDIAGLAKGASKGEGLGNKFLGHIREVTAIAHVVRCFQDEQVQGGMGPMIDIETINMELMIADLENLQKRKVKLEKTAKSGNKESRFQVALLDRIIQALNSGQPTRSLKLDATAEHEFVRSLNLLTYKPVLYICNVSDPADLTGDAVSQVKDLASKEAAQAIAIAGKLETEIIEIEDAQEQCEFLQEMGLKKSCLTQVIHAGYELLGLATFFTAGGKENRAWTIKQNASAPQAAGVIHSDFEKGFIRAKVYHFEDLAKHKSEQAVKEAGLMRLEGKNYLVRDGDIIEFLFNV